MQDTGCRMTGGIQDTGYWLLVANLNFENRLLDSATPFQFDNE
jgi:hypothetical protein